MKVWASLLIVSVGLAGCGKSEKMADGELVVKEKPSESAASMAGWKELKAGGITLSIPDDWKSVDLTAKDLRGALATSGVDEATGKMVEGLAKSGMFKAFAAAPKPVDGFLDNVNVIQIPTNAKLAEVLKANVDQMSQMGMKVKKSETLQDPERGIIHSTQAVGGKSYNTYTAIFVGGGNYYTVTFSSSKSTQAETEKIADQACRTAKF